MEHLEEDLLCPVCFSLFEDPRSLPCAHTFCRPCLEAIFEQAGLGGGAVRAKRPGAAPPRCPACQRPVEAEEARLVPANYALAAVLETFRRGRRAGTHEHPCHEHPSQPASMFCSCERLLVCVRCIAPGGPHAGHAFDSPERAAVREWAQLDALAERLDAGDKWADVRRRISLQERRRTEAAALLSQQEREVQRRLQRLSSSLRSACLRATAAHAALRASVHAAMAGAAGPARELLARRDLALAERRDFGAAHADRDAGASARLSFLRDAGGRRRRLEALCAAAPPRVLALAPGRRPPAETRRFRAWAAAVELLLARAPVEPDARPRVVVEEEEGPYGAGATLLLRLGGDGSALLPFCLGVGARRALGAALAGAAAEARGAAAGFGAGAVAALERRCRGALGHAERR
uniref:E3 ubiquitin-protein ligase TRIM13-like n=1 Tax=Petromyzon marinus TaxID=7757 RepID=A0AAJ7UHS4_PETMA|nr:E3 ubiquitin-protein ligase TRIM13-like [Petromyzon marinus]